MKQQPTTPQTLATARTATASGKTVVMGMGTITPAIREHLGKSLEADRTETKPVPGSSGR